MKREPDGYEDTVEIVGEVLAVDLKKRRLRLWRDKNTSVDVVFAAGQEHTVTDALCQHSALRLRVAGRGWYSAKGRLLRVQTVESLTVEKRQESVPTNQRIEHQSAELGKRVPDEEWSRLPADLLDNLDHYLYGSPKKT